MAEALTVRVKDIVTNGNVRHKERNIAALAKSIEKLGLLSPLTVIETDDGKWELVAGHRRLAAAQKLKWQDVPVHVVGKRDHGDVILSQLTENMQRDDLTTYEEAQAFLELGELDIPDNYIAAATGRTRKQVGEVRQLANLSKKQYKVVSEFSEDDQLSIASLAETPELLDEVIEKLEVNLSHGYRGNPQYLVQDAERKAKHRKQVEALLPKLDKLREAGIEVVSTEPNPVIPHKWELVSRSGLDVKAHRKESCAAVAITENWQDISLSEYCSAPQRHTATGDSELKYPDEEKRAKLKAEQAEDRKQQRVQQKARQSVLTEVVSQKYTNTQYLVWFATAVIELAAAEICTKAAKLLGIETDVPEGQTPSGYDYKRALLNSTETHLKEAAAVIVAYQLNAGPVWGAGNVAFDIIDAYVKEAGGKHLDELIDAEVKELEDS